MRNMAFDTRQPRDHNRTLPIKSDESRNRFAYDYTGVVISVILLLLMTRCALLVDMEDAVTATVRHHNES